MYIYIYPSICVEYEDLIDLSLFQHAGQAIMTASCWDMEREKKTAHQVGGWEPQSYRAWYRTSLVRLPGLLAGWEYKCQVMKLR